MSFGQSNGNSGTTSQAALAQHLQELALRDLENQNPVVDRQQAERRRARERDQEFSWRANQVVALWSEVIADHNARQVNLKKIRKLSKAFHELEKSQGWLDVSDKSRDK